MTRHRRTHHARGFTLIELSLAIVLAGLIMGGCMSLLMAMRSADRAFSSRFERSSELDITWTSLTRAMLSLQMKEAVTTTVVRAGSDAQQEEESASDRDRFILETDPTVEPDSTGWVPQRFEVVCATPPVPPGLASRASAWYTAQSREESLDFSALDGSQGTTRGVFELRQRGEREALMQRVGLSAPGSTPLTPAQMQTQTLDRATAQIPQDAPPSWTLWWRPILTGEAEMLNAGYPVLPDAVGTQDEIRERLAGAIPLLHGIERCMWEFYKEDEYITEHRGLEMDALPAFAQFEVILTNQQYASWMFEVDWVMGDDPLDVATAASADGQSTDGDDTNDPPGGGGGGGGNNGSGGRPGGGGSGRPGGDNQFDMSGDS